MIDIFRIKVMDTPQTYDSFIGPGIFLYFFAIFFRIRDFMSHIDYRRRKEGAMDPKEILSELRNLYIAKSIIVPLENGIRTFR